MAADFSGLEFSEEENMLRAMVREFAEKEVWPRAEHIDKTGDFPWDNINRMKELGLFGVPVPTEYGGAGLGRVGYCIVVEELGRAAVLLIAELADHRGRLIADLAPGEGTSNHRHRLQLLADTNPVESRGNRHAAGLADPGGGRDVAGDQMVTALLASAHH